MKGVKASRMRWLGGVAVLLLGGALLRPLQAMPGAGAPLLPPLLGSATRGDHALLWKVERAGLRPSYVFGTLRSPDPRAAALSPAVLRAFRFSDVFAMELIPDHVALERMSASMFNSGGPNLKVLLGEAYFDRAAIIMAKFGISSSLLIELKPWVVFTALTLPKPEDGLFPDVILYAAALNDGKRIHGLETADEQVDIFAGIRPDDQVAILKGIIGHYASLSAINREMVRRYSEGDIDAVSTLQDQYFANGDQRLIRSFHEHAVDERSRRIVERIMPRIEEQNAFIAIDAALLAGDQGVLHQLQERGYTISPVY